MKAVVMNEYGSPDVLKLETRQKPTPKENEVLIKVHASSVKYGDLIARRFNTLSAREFNMPFLFWLLARLAFGLKSPKVQVLGAEFSGTIEAVGSNVTRFKKGEAVFGYRGQSMGTYAEYLTMSEDALLITMPTNVTYDEASTIPYGALTAYSLLKNRNIQAGQKILIVGASGAIGSAAVQLAKHFGAEVTAVCSSAGHEYVKALGADHVIDYTRQDFTQNGQTYDLIFDVLGKGSFTRSKKSLNPNGRYICASFKMKKVFQMMWTSLVGGKKLICALSSENADDLSHIKQLMENGKIKAIIDRVYPFEQTADAHRYLENGHKKGDVIIRVAHS